ncbi:MAG TPA: N-acetylornithine carbamoyltransferase, partial [Gemmatimonadales bacterium]
WSLETELAAVMDGTTVEHIIEAARVLGRYADALGLRSFPKGTDWEATRRDETVRNFAKYCEKPLINMESARRHPCQGLADALTMQEQLGETRGKKFVLHWAWHPKALPTAVPNSAAIAAAHLGMEVVIARPKGYDLDPEDMGIIEKLATSRGGKVSVTDDLDGAIDGAHAVYPKSWGALQYFGRPEEESQFRSELRDWRLTEQRVKSTKDGKGKVLHCLPVRRNVEIDGAVLDGPNSAVIDEAENRLHAQRALLLELIGKK